MKKSFLFSVILFCSVFENFAEGQSAAASSGGIAVKEGEKIAFLGDSITQFGFRNPTGYVNLVVGGLGSSGLKVTPIPAGISGNTSNNMIGRLANDVIAKKPNWVTISCGVNDVWHSKGVELDLYKTNMTSIVDQCQAAGIKVMLLTATMIGEDQVKANNQKLIAYNEFIRTLAKEKKCLLADLNARMQEALKSPDVAAANPGKKLTEDGVHMNALGNQMMATGVLLAFGLTEAQIQSAKVKWDDIPNAMDLGMVSVSLRQYKALESVAAKRNQSVKDMVTAAMAKTVESLIKE
jgi:lysophospholipase L1-like esterase